MRYIRYAFMAALAIMLVTVAVANRTMTELNLLPAELENLIGFNLGIVTPVFVVFFVGTIFGVLVGFVWEWLREYKHRAEVTRKSRELRRAEREISKLKADKYKDKDDVLALLDEPTA
jgi:putative membrane protein